MPEVARADTQAGWTTVSLGDVVEVINDYWDRDTTIPERLVAGKHIDEGDMRIRRWGMTDDDLIPPTFNRRFQARDALLHSRNIDKVAQPDFGGITGEKIFILRSKDEDSLLQELVPYLVASDRFRQYAESRWAGSTNKFLNKTPLMQYEFALPSLDEQRRIVEVLQAAQELKERLRLAREALSDVSSSWIESSLASNEWPESVATDVLDRATVGIVIKPAALYVPEGTGIPALRSLNIAPHRIVMSDCVNISHEGHRDHKKSRLQPGDLAIVRSGRPGDAAVIPDGLGELNCIDLIIATPGEHLRSEFLCAVLNSRYGRRQFASGIAGTAQKHFNVGLFKKLKIPVPSLETQDGFIAHMHQLQRATTSLEDRLKVQGDVASSLLEEVMSI